MAGRFAGVLFVIFIVFIALIQADDQKTSKILDKNDANHFKGVGEIWTTHSHPYLLHKWTGFAKLYDKHLPRPVFSAADVSKRKEIRLLEIGVQSGGSLIDWKRFYGDNSVIVGVDINPGCARSHMPEEKIFVEIGSQLDKEFLWRVCAKYGPFNVIIDDGGHTEKMFYTSLHAMFANDTCLSRTEGDSMYIIEDLHAAMMKQFFHNYRQFSHGILSEAFRAMHVHYAEVPEDKAVSLLFQDKLTSTYLYDSIVFFEKGFKEVMTDFKKGSDAIPYT